MRGEGKEWRGGSRVCVAGGAERAALTEMVEGGLEAEEQELRGWQRVVGGGMGDGGLSGVKRALTRGADGRDGAPPPATCAAEEGRFSGRMAGRGAAGGSPVPEGGLAVEL